MAVRVADNLDYTRKTFWGGPSYPYWLLITVTILFGLIGGDHFLLRSPTTGLAKIVVNIFGLGLWYLYDIIQIISDKKHVKENGLTLPIIGPAGIGAGMCVDDQPDAKRSKSPLRFLLYLCLVFMPFGIDSYVAGDTNGAFVKFITCINPFLWIIAFIWSTVNVFRVFFMPKSLFTEGLLRPFPVNWFMDSHGRSILGPVEVPKSPDSCDPGGTWGILRTITSFATGILSTALSAVLNVIAPGLIPAVTAVTGATTAVAGTVKVGAETAKVGAETAAAALRTAKKGIETVEQVALPLVGQAATAVTQTGALANAVGGELSTYANPGKLSQVAVPVPTFQQGGGGSPIEFLNPSLDSTALFVLFTGILAGGTYLAAKRLNISFNRFNRDDKRSEKRNTKGQQRDDTPP